MRRSGAALGSSLFLALAPGTMAGVVPWLITRWRFAQPIEPMWPVRLAGAALVVAGALFLGHAFVRFVVDGAGTPAPVAPTEQLVMNGVYRHVRNPMYLAVTATIVGQSLLFGQPWLLTYAAVFIAITASFVHWYEEPTLAQQFPADYPNYRAAVPGWWPRRRPYQARPDHAVPHLDR